MIYKSAELCREEQAIVEHALNSLADGIEKRDLKLEADVDIKLRKMISELTHERKITLP